MPPYEPRHLRSCGAVLHRQKYVVVGLSDDCAEHDGHDCVSWVFGFDDREEAAKFAGSVPQGFRPHLMTLQNPKEGQ